MNKVTINKADPNSSLGGRLNQLALDYMAYSLAGSKEDSTINETFNQLWRWDNNRFSHQYAFEAKMGEQTLGMITCYPITLMNRLAWPTFLKLLSYRKWELIGYNIMNWKECYSMITLKEGRADEFHIGTLAALPESRGLGVGSALIRFAEEQAVLQGFPKCSLTVKKENLLAIKLYEKLGYQKTGEIEKPAISVYSMSKKLVRT
jgi:ribosomal protein S18 acetylase RimI-like enzyme